MAKAKYLTVENLWQCERIGTPSVSPDGKWVVVDQSTYSMEINESTTQLWLYSTDGRVRRQLTSAGKKNTAPQWSPDGKSIAFCAKRESDDASQLYVIAPDGGEARRVTKLSNGVGSIRWFPDSKHVAAISWVWPDLKTDAQQAKRRKEQKESKVQAKVIETDNYRYWDSWICDGTRPHLFEINVSSGVAKDLFAGKLWSLGLGDPGSNDFAISPDGNEIAWVAQKDVTRLIDPSTLTLLNLKTRKTKTLSLGDAMWLASPVYSHDGTRMIVLATPAVAPSQHTRLMLVDRKSGKAERLAAAWPRSVGTYGGANPAWDADDSAILFTAEDSGVQHLWSLPLSAAEPTAMARGGHIMSFSQSADRKTLVYTKASMDHPARLYGLSSPVQAEPVEAHVATRNQPFDELRANENKLTRRLDRLNAFLEKIPLGKWESRTVKGWNGEPVQTFVCFPPNYDKKKKYPLLQDIHGGPHTAHLDTWHYRWNVQAFAAQGYVVAAVNYHGSAGFDEPFLGSIDGDLGPRELADTEAVTDVLIKEGIVDKNKLYAAGGSYGGYMVAWMNGHTDRYKAYVCHAGVYNWVSQFGDDGYLWLNQELGVWPWEDLEKYQSQSPHAYAKNFKTPTLVIHGELDYRVPYYEGLEYYNTLRAKGIAARLVVYPDENHWILKPQNSRLWYREFFAWLKRF